MVKILGWLTKNVTLAATKEARNNIEVVKSVLFNDAISC
jgi:hypothetical protein